MFLLLILIFCYHFITGQERLRYWAKALLWVLPERFSGEPGTEDSWAGLHYLYPANLGQIRGVVQGLCQGCSWAEDESSEAEANFTMLSLLSPWQHTPFHHASLSGIQFASGAKSGMCLFFRDVVERRMSHQRVYWTLLWISPCFKDWSLSFLSLFVLLLLEGIEQIP